MDNWYKATKDTLKELTFQAGELQTIKATLKVNFNNQERFPEKYIGYNDLKSITWNLVNILEHLIDRK